MSFDGYYQLGWLVKTHGLNGELTANLDVDEPEAYEDLESVFLNQNGKLLPYFIESIALRGAKAIIAFDEVLSVDEAKSLVGAELYLPVSELPELNEGQYYFHELVGMKLFDGDKLIGKIGEVFDMPNNTLISVDANGTEVLVPLQDEIIKRVDKQSGEVHASLPEGLLDVYFDDAKES